MTTNEATGIDTSQALPSAASTTSFQLSRQAQYLLSMLSDKQQRGERVKITDVSDELNDAFGELLQYKLVELPAGTGDVVTTAAGENAIGKGIAVVYPLMPSGTARDYNNTHLSMSPQASNANLKALTATWPTVGPRIDKRTLAGFVEALQRTGTFHKVPAVVNTALYEHLRDCMVYYASKSPIADRIQAMKDNASFWESQLRLELDSLIEDLEIITLKNPLKLGSSSSITGLKKLDNGSLIFTLRDDFTQEISEKSESLIDLTINQLTDLIDQLA